MKMTKKQAKIILIVGWIVFAVVYLATMVLCLRLHHWLYVTLLVSGAWLMVTEYRRYIARLKKQKCAKAPNERQDILNG